MLKEEILKTIKSTKSRLVFAIMVIIAAASSIYVLICKLRYPEMSNHPVYETIISAGDYTYEFACLYVWFMPIFLTVAYCEKYVNEIKCGMTSIYYTRASKKQHFFAKIANSFIYPVAVNFIANIINFLMSGIILHGNKGIAGLEYWSVEEFSTIDDGISGKMVYYFVQHPYFAYFVHLLSFMFVCGLIGIMCQCLCFIFRDNRIAYILSFAIWMVMYATPQLSLNEIIQPFLPEFEFYYSILSLVYYLVFVFLLCVAAYFRTVRRKDEI